jgi:L-ascorbate metabolism protein UlaG (beta-lactamase superfamily)
MRWRLFPLLVAVVLAACSARVSGPKPAASPATAPITLEYLGVAGWQLTTGDHVLLVDPFVSRGQPDGATLVSDPALVARFTPAHADVILVGHSHYDHVLDVPAIAARTGAVVVGTESTLNFARASGVAEARLRGVHGGESFEVGPFAVRVVRGLHSLTGQASAEIPRQLTLPMKADGYGEGGTLQYLVTVGGKSVLFIDTANLIDGELDGLRPDVAVIATGLREKIPDYACRLMRALGRPPLVLTNHFDAWREPLGPKQADIGDDGRADLAKFADEVHVCAPSTRVVVPTHLEPFTPFAN